MQELYVDQLMSRPVETVTPDTPIRDAADTLISNDVGAVVVSDGDRLEGLLTATDFAALVRDGETSSDATVADVMRTDVVETRRDAPVREVAEAMLERSIHHVPVTDGDTVVGMITTLDLTAHLARSLRS
jgi:CBS domain-containing protein